MNVNCAAGTDWSRNLDSSCSLENVTVAVHESEESNVVLGGHSPTAVPRPEGLDSECRHAACPASPQLSTMLSAPEDTHPCPFQDGNKRQSDYFTSQERHGCSTVSSNSSSQTVAPEKVTLVVDGTRFAVNPQIFTAHPDTMLGRWVVSIDLKIARGGQVFAEMEQPPSVCFASHLYAQSEVDPIQNLAALLLDIWVEQEHIFILVEKAHPVVSVCLGALLHELSNDGAHKQFDSYLEELILPIMVDSARKGERECHIVVLTDEDTVDWDEDHPPPMGEEYSQILYSSKLYRFFKYIENRDVAKAVLKERGLKNIRIGIEG
ncbi:KCD20 protein, partial [Brachypteracias leptosomus]|nr:KCD20 protein [Brachypteracias leptosomus]